MGGVIFTIIYFVLFVLPSYLFSILGWGMLTALFGAGGKYCFKYFTGKEIKAKSDKNVIDVAFTESDAEYAEEQEDPESEPEAEAEATRKRTTRKKSDA